MLGIFIFFLLFEHLLGGVVFIQMLAVSLDCFLTIALWEFSPSSRYRASLKGLFHIHISKNNPAFHLASSLSKVSFNFDKVVFTFFQYFVFSSFKKLPFNLRS